MPSSPQRGSPSHKGGDDDYKDRVKPETSSFWNNSAMAISVLALGVVIPLSLGLFSMETCVSTTERPLPDKAQIIDQTSLNVLDIVPPPSASNATMLFIWPDVTTKSLTERPFHVYDSEFYDIIGSDPSLTLIATTDTDPIFYEAVVWYPPTDEMFFAQNAGDPAARTGLNKSSVLQKISLVDAEALRNGTHAENEVKVYVVPEKPKLLLTAIIGGTNYKGEIIFAGEGQGDTSPSALYLMNPVEPYNTTVLINNYFGRQFNSINDVSISPQNGDIYFTDTMYGNWQFFRPKPGLPNQVYRFNRATGALTVVADGFESPNGLTFSPDGSYAYVTDTGLSHAQHGLNFTRPATIYRFEVQKDDGRTSLNTLPMLKKRKAFSYSAWHLFIHDPRLGIHCDSKGNVYAGCGDGVHVWNRSGKLIGKIYTGVVVANFQFAGKGRMIIMGRTNLFYATLAASGAPIN
ncbi:gluconolactonase [Fusarium oxysporum f. sp. melonis 26406]|uniref:Gluconolactonase n=1 Tax=Fusarium oxysporum f. sp. melonis 26406 TaxID=1089452 RepID=W9ZXI8_FUSOX|nr:gluconolactonase [Fusarium oxysporum f. sp. melonis 26406]